MKASKKGWLLKISVNEGIDFNYTSGVSSKFFFQIPMELAVHPNLELHHMDLETTLMDNFFKKFICVNRGF